MALPVVLALQIGELGFAVAPVLGDDHSAGVVPFKRIVGEGGCWNEGPGEGLGCSGCQQGHRANREVVGTQRWRRIVIDHDHVGQWHPACVGNHVSVGHALAEARLWLVHRLGQAHARSRHPLAEIVVGAIDARIQHNAAEHVVPGRPALRADGVLAVEIPVWLGLGDRVAGRTARHQQE